MTTTINIEELYAQQLRPLPLAARLRLIELLAHDLAIATEQLPATRSILELEGVGAELWRGIDAQEYVNALRDEWDNRE
jgi:hypothetical protein